MFNIVNNFIDNEQLHEIEKIINFEYFPWFINSKDPLTFTHNIVKQFNGKTIVNSDFFSPIVEPVVNKLKITNIDFAQLYLFPITKEKKSISGKFNIQSNPKLQKIILVLNNSDGYIETVNHKFEVEENRAFLFRKREPNKIHTPILTNSMFLLEIDYL